MMTQVQAAQHIYTNVETDQSPHNRGGFQTLFHTQARLTEAEVLEAETRSLYYPGESNPVKSVFFTTATGKAVVSRIVPLSETDRLGRAGRYLAHSLVFSPEDFASFGADPFLVFRTFPFIDSLAQALEQGDFKTGNIPAATLQLSPAPDQMVEVSVAWRRKELGKLTLLALQAERLARERSTIVCTGQPEAILRALEAAFVAVPGYLRPLCSFDTHFFRCNLVATYFWAVGLSEAMPGRSLVVDAAGQTIVTTTSLEPQSSYERWALSMIDVQNLSRLNQEKDRAFPVCELIDGRSIDASAALSAPPEIVSAVLNLNGKQAQDRLRARLGEQLPPLLVDRVLGRLSGWLRETELIARLCNGFISKELLDQLYQAYATKDLSAPSPAERREMERLMRETSHPLLRTLQSCWTGKMKDIRRSLEDLSEDEYTQFLRAAVPAGIVDPILLLIPGRAQSFVETYLAVAPRAKRAWVAVVKALLSSKQAECLALLTPTVREWGSRDLQGVRRIIAHQPSVPDSFRRAILEAVRSATPKGIKGFFRRTIGR